MTGPAALSTNLVSPYRFSVVLVTLATTLVLAPALPAADPQPIVWITPEKIPTLAAQDKPVLVYFTAAWCRPCRLLEQEVFSDRHLAAFIAQRFVTVKAVDRLREEGRNTEAVARLKRVYGVQAFPTLLITDAEGHTLARSTGYAPGRQQLVYQFLLEGLRAMEKSRRKKG